MHGLIFNGLKEYITAIKGDQFWSTVCEESHTSEFHLPTKAYDDQELYQICQKASELLNTTLTQFLEDFGKFLMKVLINTYDSWIKPEWDCLEFLLNVECVMHGVARRISFTASKTPHPPQLKIIRIDQNTIELHYSSPRKLCSLAKGLIIGAGQYYQVDLEVKETCCMHKDSPNCLFEIRKIIT